MYGKRLKILTLLGFDVYVDLSWLVVAVLIIWSLATGIFPHFYPNLSNATLWLMGAAGALGLFLSIVIHEFAHSLIARQCGMRMNGITLFIFGGVAEMSDEPPNARSEFWVALAGPIASVALALLFYAGHGASLAVGMHAPIAGVLGYLASVNALLVTFNILPAFPLDGGRVLRSLLWAWKADLNWATRIVSRIGQGFGLVLLGLGVFSFFSGNLIGGLWWFMIGLFLRRAAEMSYQELLLRQTLAGEPVSRFMHADIDSVSPNTSLDRFVDEYIYRRRQNFYPVVRDGELLGAVGLEEIRNVPRSEWANHTVGEIVERCDAENTITDDADAVQALKRMNRNHRSRLIVIDHEKHLAGLLALRDLVKFLSLEVEGEGA